MQKHEKEKMVNELLKGHIVIRLSSWEEDYVRCIKLMNAKDLTGKQEMK